MDALLAKVKPHITSLVTQDSSSDSRRSIPFTIPTSNRTVTSSIPFMVPNSAGSSVARVDSFGDMNGQTSSCSGDSAPQTPELRGTSARCSGDPVPQTPELRGTSARCSGDSAPQTSELRGTSARSSGDLAPQTPELNGTCTSTRCSAAATRLYRRLNSEVCYT